MIARKNRARGLLFLLLVLFNTVCAVGAEKRFSNLVGSYALSAAVLDDKRYRIEVLEEKVGVLILAAADQKPVQFVSVSGTRFKSRIAADNTIEFQQDRNGVVNSFLIKRFFGTQTYRRLSLLEPHRNLIYNPKGVSELASGYQIPPQLSDGLVTNSYSLNSEKRGYLFRLLEGVGQGRFGNIHSLLLLKDGELVVEQYYGDWRRIKAHLQRSATKSVVSLLIGTAIDQGYIASVEDPILTYLPNYKHLLKSGKEDITLRDLLTMSAGLAWSLSAGDGAALEISSKNSVAFMLGKKLTSTPGKEFTYSDGFSIVAGEILKNATGSNSVQEYAESSLLSRLGLDWSNWLKLADGRQASNYGLSLTAREMAKIGQLVLNRGLWQGERVVSADWIDESTKKQVSLPQIYQWQEYGYLWWGHQIEVNGKQYNVRLAEGFGGQYIIVISELNLVVVSTADNHYFPYDNVMAEILTKLIIPAFE